MNASTYRNTWAGIKMLDNNQNTCSWQINQAKYGFKNMKMLQTTDTPQ